MAEALGCTAGLADGFVVPVNIDEPFRGRRKSRQRLAIPPMDRNALAGRYDANDFISGHRMAAAGKSKGHAGHQPGHRHIMVWPRRHPPSGQHGGHHPRPPRRLPQFRVRGVHHVPGQLVAIADGDIQFLDRRDLQRLQRWFQRPLRPIDAGLAERLGQFDLAGLPALLTLFLVDEPPDPRPSLAGDDETIPLRRRSATAGRHDLHLVTVLQMMPQRHQPAVDLGADAGIADLAVHGIGEIHRRRAPWQLDQLAFRRETEHLVGVEFQLGVFQKLIRRRRILQDLQQILHPAEALHVCAVDLLFRRLVNPVRGDPVFGDVIHLGGANLHFDLLIARMAQRHAGMQRLVAVWLRGGDVVLEPPGDHRIRGMHRTQRRVAVRFGLHDNAERHDVRQLLKRNIPPVHLLPDREWRLFPPHDLNRFDTSLTADLNQFPPDVVDNVRALPAQEVQARQDRGVSLGFQLHERQRLQLGLHRVHADAFGQRRIDFHRLARGAFAAFGVANEVQRPHVVQPIRQLHQQHTDIPAHGQDQFAEILGLLGAVGLQFQASQLGDTVNQAGDLLAKAALDLRQLVGGIFDNIVQQRGGDRGNIQPVASQDIGHRDRMHEIRVAVFAPLRAVRLFGQVVGRVDQGRIGLRVVFMDFSGQLTRRDQTRARRLRQNGKITGGGNRNHSACGGRRGPVHLAAETPVVHTGLPRCSAAEFRLDGRFQIFGREFLRAFAGQAGRFFLGRDILQAENVLVGRDQVQHFLVGWLRLRRAGQRLDQVLLDARQFDRLVRDFAQGDDGVLVVVAINRELFPAADVAGTLGSEQNQLEAIGNFLNAVFNGDARHALILRVWMSGNRPFK